MDTTYSFPTEFTVPAELGGQTPRSVLLTGSGIQLALAAAILLALAAAGAVWAQSAAARPSRHDSAVSKSGAETESAIARLRKSGSRVSHSFSAGAGIDRPAAWKAAPHSQLAPIVAPAVAAALGLMLLILLGIEYRLAARGKPAVAVVSKCTRGKSGYFVRYSLRLGEERWTEGRGWCKNYQEPGNGIWVLYPPGRPRRSRPYPLTYCRAIE